MRPCVAFGLGWRLRAGCARRASSGCEHRFVYVGRGLSCKARRSRVAARRRRVIRGSRWDVAARFFLARAHWIRFAFFLRWDIAWLPVACVGHWLPSPWSARVPAEWVVLGLVCCSHPFFGDAACHAACSAPLAWWPVSAFACCLRAVLSGSPAPRTSSSGCFVPCFAPPWLVAPAGSFSRVCVWWGRVGRRL